MQFSKAVALDLLDVNVSAYALANTGQCVLPAGYSEAIPIRMPVGNRPFFLRGDPLDIWGFVTTKDRIVHVVFRGTQITSGLDFAQEWIEDAVSLPLAKLGTGSVHLGFYGAWMALRSATMQAMGTIAGGNGRVITGHSLGAAIATLCWADLGGDLMSFASPRVGDPDFAKSLWDGQTVRIVNAPDEVPNAPTDPPFRHGGQEIKVYGPGGLLDLKEAHQLTSYKAGIEAME